jgi:hypothetical protein
MADTMGTMRTRLLNRLGLLLMFLPLSVVADELTIDDAWIRAAPPGAHMLAGYASLRNTGSADVRLVSAASDRFGLVEVHRTVEVDGVARMREVDVVEIPAGGEVQLAPGGLHLMLMRPQRDTVEGERIVMRLRFDDGKEREVEFGVRRNAVKQGH